MENLFINLENGKVRVVTYRNPSATVTDLADILNAIRTESDETLVCSADDALTLLDDGAWQAEIHADQNAVEVIYNALQEV